MQISNVSEEKFFLKKLNAMEAICYDIVLDTNYGNILFEPDFKKWEKIKDYTYGEYIHKQLENYNFSYNATSTEE